jgi:amino acid permease
MIDFKEIIAEPFQKSIGISNLYNCGLESEDFKILFENKNFNLHELKILESIDLDTLSFWVAISMFPFSEYPLENISKMNKCYKKTEHKIHISIDIERHFNL